MTNNNANKEMKMENLQFNNGIFKTDLATLGAWIIDCRTLEQICHVRTNKQLMECIGELMKQRFAS